MEIGDNGEGPIAESAIGDGPSTVLNADEEATIVSAPITIAEQLDAVKVEEAEMLRKFEKTHKRFIKVMIMTFVVFLILFPAGEISNPSAVLEFEVLKLYLKFENYDYF